MEDPSNNLAETALQKFGFSPQESATIKATKRVIFILDGLDELSSEKIPPIGIIASNSLFEWPHSKVIITSHIDFMASLETQFNIPHCKSLAQGKTGNNEFYLMPFDDAQMEQYIYKFATMNESEWSSPQSYMTFLDSVRGFKELVRTPFMLKLALPVIPRLQKLRTGSEITRADVYEEFTNKYFEQETWKEVTRGDIPLSENHPASFAELAERLAQELFLRGTTRAAISLNENDTRLARGIPRSQFADNTIGFIYKSVQEFFTARAWMRALDKADQARLQEILGARPVMAELGVIEFVCKYFHPSSHFTPLLRQVLALRNAKTVIEANQSDQICTAAANAITLLVASGTSLSGLDLSNVCIRGANLNGVIADGTNFSHSNLSGASMRQAWLRKADLQGADLTGVELGQHPKIECLQVKFIAVCNSQLLTVSLPDYYHEEVSTFSLPAGQVLQKFTPVGITKKKSEEPQFWFASGEELVLAVIDKNEILTIWRASTRNTQDWSHVGKCIAVSVHEGRVITTSYRDGVMVWDLATCHLMLAVDELNKYCLQAMQAWAMGHTINYNSDTTNKQYPVVFSICASTVISLVECYNKIVAWDIVTGQTLYTTEQDLQNIYSIAASRTKVVWSVGGLLTILDTVTGLHQELQAHAAKICYISIHDQLLITADYNILWVWNLTTYQVVGSCRASIVRCVAFWNQKIIAASNDEITIFDIPTTTYSTTKNCVVCGIMG